MNDAAEKSSAPRGATREMSLFFLRFLAVSIALYLLYYFVIGTHYVRFIALMARPALAAFGYEFIMENAVRITEDIALNPFVFLSLVAAVGHISWKAKLRGAGVGIVILAVANALTVTLAFVSNYRQSEAWWTGTELLNLTNNFFVPILLWLALLPIRSAFPFFRNTGS